MVDNLWVICIALGRQHPAEDPGEEGRLMPGIGVTGGSPVDLTERAVALEESLLFEVVEERLVVMAGSGARGNYGDERSALLVLDPDLTILGKREVVGFLRFHKLETQFLKNAG